LLGAERVRVARAVVVACQYVGLLSAQAIPVVVIARSKLRLGAAKAGLDDEVNRLSAARLRG